LSARYSNSPSLRLVIADSRAGRVLHALFLLVVLYSLFRLSQRGYPLLAVTLLPAVALCCWRLARQRYAGACIIWERGEWSIERGGGCRRVGIHPGSTCLSWVIYLAWVDLATGRRDSVFLLPDSATAQQLRGLRVRLALER